MVHGDSQCLPEQCERPVTATTTATYAGVSDGSRSSVQPYMPGIDSEPEDAATEPEDWDDDLGVAALDEEVNQLLATERDSDSEIDSEAVTTSNTSTDSTTGSIWYRGQYPLHRKSPLCVQADRKRKESDRERQLRDEPLLSRMPMGAGPRAVTEAGRRAVTKKATSRGVECRLRGCLGLAS